MARAPGSHRNPPKLFSASSRADVEQQPHHRFCLGPVACGSATAATATLLFVFMRAELPEDNTPEQRQRFAAGAGGALVPLMCVDKTPGELSTFAALAEESYAAWPHGSTTLR